MPSNRSIRHRARRVHRPERAHNHVPDIAGSACVALTGRVRPRRLVHPPARVRRLASPLGHLGRAAVLLRGRSAVPPVDVAACGWARGAVAVVAARADLPGVAYLAVVLAAVVVGVGLTGDVSPVVTLDASWGT